jgi:S-adenosylmethionine:tRNA ribosyltransferase-isomerase
MQARHKIIVVGTSTARALETSVTADGFVKQSRGWTDKFIYPPYDFKIVDRLITNFHMEESTLLMLVCALAGTDFVMRAYKKALKEHYRFLSYGDAMLVI